MRAMARGFLDVGARHLRAALLDDRRAFAGGNELAVGACQERLVAHLAARERRGAGGGRERLRGFAGRHELAVGARLEDARLDFGAARAAGRVGGERAAGGGRQGSGEDREGEDVLRGSLRFLEEEWEGRPETFSGSDI